jgi:RNA polymerase sigma-70 factor (ECF subfamily)
MCSGHELGTRQTERSMFTSWVFGFGRGKVTVWCTKNLRLKKFNCKRQRNFQTLSSEYSWMGFNGPESNGVDMTPVDDGTEHLDTAKDYVETVDPMYPASNVEILMTRYQQGDFAAATTLIDRLSPQLHRFFVTQFASRVDADDLLQETWLRIHKVRHTYRPGEPVLPWFYAIARHVRVDHYRKASRTTAREQRLEEISEAEVAITEESPMTNDLVALLAPLPESQREVITMLKVVGMSLEEVARATSSSVGSVKQKVHRAYEKLRQRMGAMELRKARSGGRS